MKTLRPSPRDERGSTLLIAVVALATISFLLLSYMNLSAGVNRSVVRSQVWNEALSIAEAGIEEALMNMNYNGTTNLVKSGNGWYAITGGAATARWLTYAPSNSAYAYYYVTVTNLSSPAPTVTGHGWSRLPPAYGGNNWQWINRIVQVNCTRGARHPRGMLAESFINMNGNNIRTDSYDSDDPAHSTPNGRYDPTKAKQNGDIGTNLTVTNSVTAGNANINGSVATGAGGTVALGPMGSITGTITHDMNVDFNDVLAPFAVAPGIQPGTAPYNFEIPAGNTLMGSLSFSGGERILVTGKAKLYVTGDFSLTGTASIELAPNATLEIYVGGSDTKISGKGIVNNSSKASAVSYFGLPGNTKVDLSGNSEFTGTIYAPNAAFTASGAGTDPLDFAGAVVAKTIKLNGHFKLHYDEALGRIPSPDGITITSWREL